MWHDIVKCLVATIGIAAHAQTFTRLGSFNGPNGSFPYSGSSLVLGINGDFYGTTGFTGSADKGVIFVVTPQGGLDALHTFVGSDGMAPLGGLMVAPNGMLYGTTYYGGANDDGTVFQIDPGSGELRTVHTFDLADGANPLATLAQAFDGMFYGTTAGGPNGSGTIFRMTPAGALATLYTFSEAAPFDYPGLVQATDGMLYGTTTTTSGGDGTVYSIGPNGGYTALFNFDGSTGIDPQGTLVQGADGDLYGTTQELGPGYYGTVFRITLAGKLTSLHSFERTDGGYPAGALVQGTDGNFYGTTAGGGKPDNCGTIFRITPAGALTTLHYFENLDGCSPLAGLVQGTDGDFYGTTEYGGTSNDGTVYRLSVGLGPFVKTLPAFGIVGTAVTILGTNLTGATSVTFGGKASSFTILSPTAIQATVPPDAGTGKVRVTTPGRTLVSNVPFQVLGTEGQ